MCIMFMVKLSVNFCLRICLSMRPFHRHKQCSPLANMHVLCAPEELPLTVTL